MVESAKYQNENELQKLLADSPTLISIDDVRPGSGLLIAAVREFPLDIGYVDLLAFSAQGDLAIIECKLAENPEIKRKVIGQALEYGAHIWGMTYTDFDEKVKIRTGKNLAELVKEKANDPTWNEELFRSNVESALENGSFILMIVVDGITEDLSRIIRFVNACGNPAFSFAALEMRRFQSGDAEMLIPRVIGDTRTSENVARATGRKRWTPAMFFEDAERKLRKEELKIVNQLYEFTKQNASEVRMGTGAESGSFTFILLRNNSSGSVFSVYSNGNFTVNLGYMETICSREEIDHFRNRIGTIPSLADISKTDKYYYTLKSSVAFSAAGYLEQFKREVLELKHVLQ